MSVVGEVVDRKERPAYVQFERRAVEDKAASRREGKSISRDVDYALVTPPYSKDIFEQKVDVWLSQMDQEVSNGRLPRDWYERYKQSYEHWRRGEEMPLNGTPIKGWGVLSPAQQKNLIALHIYTVEDLAAVNDEGMRRVGMGAGELRDKAKAWLSQTGDKGPLTMEIAAVKEENRSLKVRNEHLEAKIKELAEAVETLRRGGLTQQFFDRPTQAQDQAISASEILPEDTPKRGRRKQAETPI